MSNNIEEDTSGFSSDEKEDEVANELDGDLIAPQETMSEQRHEVSGGVDIGTK